MPGSRWCDRASSGHHVSRWLAQAGHFLFVPGTGATDAGGTLTPSVRCRASSRERRTTPTLVPCPMRILPAARSPSCFCRTPGSGTLRHSTLPAPSPHAFHRHARPHGGRRDTGLSLFQTARWIRHARSAGTCSSRLPPSAHSPSHVPALRRRAPGWTGCMRHTRCVWERLRR